MAGNTKDQNLSFQAAGALRAAETWVESTTAATSLAANNAWALRSVDNRHGGMDSVIWTGANVVTYRVCPALRHQARWVMSTSDRNIIEKLTTEALLPSGTRIMVRITARGTGASNNTVSMVSRPTPRPIRKRSGSQANEHSTEVKTIKAKMPVSLLQLTGT